LLVVGDGPHRERLERLAVESGVADDVVFTGIVEDAELPAHFAAGDVFAMPCRERRGGFEVEAFGIVFIQAQAVGVPVVAGNIGGVPDAVGGVEPGDDPGGVLVDGTDLDAVTDAVGALLADRDEARRLGERGAQRVAEHFSWSARTDQLRELLRRTVNRSVG
ncbi:MAG: glycosyltransferase, partial [Actinobacteria bacterium]|nr:glycosyltransferase [Actinomycetota bacterium]